MTTAASIMHDATRDMRCAISNEGI